MEEEKLTQGVDTKVRKHEAISELCILGPADGAMVMSLDSHVVNRDSSPRPDGLKLMLDTCV